MDTYTSSTIKTQKIKFNVSIMECFVCMNVVAFIIVHCPQLFSGYLIFLNNLNGGVPFHPTTYEKGEFIKLGKYFFTIYIFRKLKIYVFCVK